MEHGMVVIFGISFIQNSSVVFSITVLLSNLIGVRFWRFSSRYPNLLALTPFFPPLKLQNSKARFSNEGHFFLLDFGFIWLTSLQFIQYHVAGFYKLTIPQSPPSHLQDYSTCNNARLEFSTIFVPSFDPNEWCLKNGFHSEGLNPGRVFFCCLNH
jgi:hypothetical protein